MPPTEQEVQTYLNDLETYRQTAIATFGCDDAEINVQPGPTAVLTLRFAPSGSTPADRKVAEQAAVDAAENLRAWGFDVQIHSDGATPRTIGTYSL
jgi:hypothetical protein